MKIFRIFKNRIIKDTISILFIFLLFFGNIAPLTIKAFSIKNIERVYPYINEIFDFHIPGFIPNFRAESSPKFQTISQYGILIGIVNVDLDNNELSKIVSRGIFLGMNRDEIINEIKNKLKSKIKTIEYEEFFIKKKINVYEYSIDNDKIIINIDSLYIDKNANPGIAVIFEVFNSTIINEEFILKSKCINENNENLGKISIDEKNFTLPNSIKLFRNERYKIKYYPNEGYEFDHWEIKNGRLSHRNNESNNVLFVQNNYGEIVAYYKKIVIKEETTITSSITSLKTSLSSSSIRTTTSIKTSSIKTQSLTSTKTEIKTTLTSTITITTVTSTITKVDILPPYKSESTSYNSETQTTTVTKTTTTTTSTVTSITQQEKSFLDTIGETIINSINDISKRILHALGFYEENISFSETTCTTTKTESQTPYKAEVTYIGKTSSQTIKVTSTTTKTNITITTTSIKTTSSNTITTISNYKYVTTKTLITTTSSSKTSTSSYDIDRHILNNLEYYENNYYNYGNGKIRSSLISNPIIYKEFLEKIKKIEENKNNIKHQYIPSYQILKYLVFKIVPIRINIDSNLYDSKIYKINVVIKNYDDIDRNFIIKIEDIKGKQNGYFLINSTSNIEESNIEEKLNILIKANYLEKIENQFFFLPIIGQEGCETAYQTSINYKKYRISIYIDSKRIFEKEITVWSSSQSKFWKGFYKALSDNWPSLALSTIALILIGVASGGAGIAAKTASMALFAMFLYSVGMNIMEVYYAYVGYDSFNKFIDKRYELIRNNYGSDIEEYIRKDEEGYINEVRGKYALDSISNFFINIEISDLLKISGIIEVDEEEKGYAAGKIFVAAYSLGTFAIGYIHNAFKNKIINKGGIYYTKEILKAWVTAPLIDALTIFYKYKQIKSLKDNKIEISENNKISNLAKKLDEIASKDKGISEIMNNAENYAMDVSTWAKHCEPFKNFIEEKVKIGEDVSANEYINKIKILKICSEIFWECLSIVDKAYGKLTKEKINKILNAIGEEIKENGINEENKYEIFKKGLSRLGIEEVELYEEEDPRFSLGKSKLEDMIKISLGDVNIQEGDYIVFRIFTEDKGPSFVIAKISGGRKQHEFGGEGLRKRIGTDTFFIKVEGIIRNPKDWYNSLIKGKIEEIKINDYHIVKILSENEIKIINKKLNLEKTFKLENVKMYFITQGRFLAIKGEVESEFNKIKIGVATDGDGNIILETYTGIEEDAGRRIKDIDLNEDRLRIKYDTGGGNIRTRALYFVDPLSLVKEIKNENDKWLINIDAAEAWHGSGSNTVRKGAIGEICGFKISEIKGYEPEGETARGKRGPPSDLKIKLDGIISPEEVKTCDLTGKSIGERNEIFNSELRKALVQIDQYFKKDVFKDSKAGIIIIIGFDENRIDPNSKYVEIDVLIVKVPSENPKNYQIISAPKWFKKS